MLRNLKQIWIAYHAPGMTAMLQLCYHKGASMACALQRDVGKQRTDVASKKLMRLKIHERLTKNVSLAKCMVMTPGSKEHCLGETDTVSGIRHAVSKERILRQAKNACFGMQSTNAASKKQMYKIDA